MCIGSADYAFSPLLCFADIPPCLSSQPPGGGSLAAVFCHFSQPLSMASPFSFFPLAAEKLSHNERISLSMSSPSLPAISFVAILPIPPHLGWTGGHNFLQRCWLCSQIIVLGTFTWFNYCAAFSIEAHTFLMGPRRRVELNHCSSQ